MGPYDWIHIMCFILLCSTLGRLVNHAINPNVTVYNKLLDVGKDKPMLAMFACKDIPKGTQLFWDYGIREPGIEWSWYKRVVSNSCKFPVFLLSLSFSPCLSLSASLL